MCQHGVHFKCNYTPPLQAGLSTTSTLADSLPRVAKRGCGGLAMGRGAAQGAWAEELRGAGLISSER